MKWKNIPRGMAMGISDVVPGVSGGTIAVILGIYDQLIAAINGLFSKEWKKHLSFLIPLAIGMGFAIYAFSHLMGWLLDHHEKVTFYFFLGLIIGILPYLFREMHKEKTFNWYHYIFVVIGIIGILLLPLPDDVSGSGAITNIDFSTYALLFGSGFLASAAMILPGISGSFVLYVIGVYDTVINAVRTFDVQILFIVACGIGIGIIVMSKIIHYALKHFRTATFSVIIGLVIGSVYVVFPGWATSASQWLATVIVFAIGLTVAYVLGKIEH